MRRKYNPHNPCGSSSQNCGKDLNVESLDDLFEIDNDEDVNVPNIEENEPSDLDIQKELEAKFDELFGPLDDDE